VLLAIDESTPSLLGRSAAPKSVSSKDCWLVSAKTIFGRAFHGVKRISDDARGGPITFKEMTDGSSRSAANTRSFAGDAVDVLENDTGELRSPKESAKIATRTPDIPLVLMIPIDGPKGSDQARCKNG
jgi:hypothetical protein